MHAVFSLLPLAAAILAVPQFLPQLARLRRTGQTAGVSWSWAALTSIDNAAWAARAWRTGSWIARGAVTASGASGYGTALAGAAGRRCSRRQRGPANEEERP